MGRFRNEAVLVVGGSSGIGLAAAQAFEAPGRDPPDRIAPSGGRPRSSDPRIVSEIAPSTAHQGSS